MTVEAKTKVERDELAGLFSAKDWDAARALSLRQMAEGDGRRGRARGFINFANAEWGAGRFNVALAALTECERAGLLDGLAEQDEVRGNYHATLALVFRALGQNDRAIEEYAGAAHYHDLAGREDMAARVENNLAFLLALDGRGEEAVERAKSALRRFEMLGDYASASEACDTLSKAYKAKADAPEVSERTPRRVARA